ncbi:hypothetical protein [Bradyrhizobium lablabi]|uniref:hypothetical protein n=1 Tax=Bradyrhizobium lablabi TaxID=722472 RepID=UPI0028A238CB|nr:hypothetical protein [Bradyrhizobium lablabi]
MERTVSVSAFAILVAIFNCDATGVLIDKARAASVGGATTGQSAMQAVPTAPPGIEAAAPSRTLDTETLAALVTRAKRLLALGDIVSARLLLERAANAQDAAAAFLLALTYDPAVLGVRDVRSIAPDPETARDWYCRAAGLGSADARQRLMQLQNIPSRGCHASAP